MDFDFISFMLGAGAGILGSAVVGRAKFAALQDRLREAEDRLMIAVEKAKTNIRKR